MFLRKYEYTRQSEYHLGKLFHGKYNGSLQLALELQPADYYSKA